MCIYNFSTTNAPYTPTVYKTVCRQHRGSSDSSELAVSGMSQKEAQLWVSSLCSLSLKHLHSAFVKDHSSAAQWI